MSCDCCDCYDCSGESRDPAELLRGIANELDSVKNVRERLTEMELAYEREQGENARLKTDLLQLRRDNAALVKRNNELRELLGGKK